MGWLLVISFLNDSFANLFINHGFNFPSNLVPRVFALGERNTLVWPGHVTRGFCVKWQTHSPDPSKQYAILRKIRGSRDQAIPGYFAPQEQIPWVRGCFPSSRKVLIILQIYAELF